MAFNLSVLKYKKNLVTFGTFSNILKNIKHKKPYLIKKLLKLVMHAQNSIKIKIKYFDFHKEILTLP